MENRLLILNHDPVFEDRLLSFFDAEEGLEIRVVRSVSRYATARATGGHISARKARSRVKRKHSIVAKISSPWPAGVGD